MIAFKRALFIALGMLLLFYSRRDYDAVTSHADLLQGIGLVIIFVIAGFSIALAYQFHEDNKKIRKKLGDETYNWLIKNK